MLQMLNGLGFLFSLLFFLVDFFLLAFAFDVDISMCGSFL